VSDTFANCRRGSAGSRRCQTPTMTTAWRRGLVTIVSGV
jgi:hypothetical protein